MVAGYIAILFGRSRRSDDLYFILEYLDEEDFLELCRLARMEGFTLLQGSIEAEESLRQLYRHYLAEGYGVRFIYEDSLLPNIEAKLARTDIHRYALNNNVTVIVNGKFRIRISPIELQIAYKLKLGSDKDIGDAVFLYTLLVDAINKDELKNWCMVLQVDCSILEG
ncbi:MAG: hypothetical protein F7C09_07000 [Aeropyrum sp.]|nr:hypothetical protein [Aeropyrum sp.]